MSNREAHEAMIKPLQGKIFPVLCDGKVAYYEQLFFAIVPEYIKYPQGFQRLFAETPHNGNMYDSPARAFHYMAGPMVLPHILTLYQDPKYSVHLELPEQQQPKKPRKKSQKRKQVKLKQHKNT